MPDPVEITLGNITEVIVEVSSAIAISGGNGTGNGTTQYGNLTIGNVTTGNAGTNANASITGTAPNQILNLTIPRGDTGQTGATGSTGSTGATGPAGPAGPANNLTISSVTTGNAGTSASVTISGTSPNQALSFTIPRGDVGATGSTGATGAAGTAASISIGTTTTGAAGTSASVTNSGTSSAAVFNFTIPQGAAGATGATGAAGPNTVTTSTTTTITGLIKGTGSVIAQAVAGTDYVTPGSLSAVATSGSATDLTTGTLANARLASSVLRNDQAVACNDQVISRFAGNTIAVTGNLTLSATHNGAVLVSTSATALNITVPTGLPTGFNCTIVQDGAGQVTVVASSTTINGRNGLKTAAQHAVIAIVPTTTANAYKVTGDTAT